MPRSPSEEVEYKEKKVKGVLDRVTAILTGKKSEVFTKISNEYKRIDETIDALSAEREKLNEKVKNHMSAMFDVEDEILTRVIESVSLTATLSKRTPEHSVDTTLFDSEGMLEELYTTMPELQAQLDILREKYTTISTKIVKPKSPALRVSVNESENDIYATLEEYSETIAQKIYSNLLSYDRKFAKLK